MHKKNIILSVIIFLILGIISTLLISLKFKYINNVSIFYTNYTLSANFKNIGNLKNKSRVTIGGVKVGFVNKIYMSYKSGSYEPTVEIKIYGDINKIPVDSSISVLMSSLLGENYLQIDLGQEEIYFKDGDIIEMTTQAINIEDLISKFVLNK